MTRTTRKPASRRIRLTDHALSAMLDAAQQVSRHGMWVQRHGEDRGDPFVVIVASGSGKAALDGALNETREVLGPLVNRRSIGAPS